MVMTGEHMQARIKKWERESLREERWTEKGDGKTGREGREGLKETTSTYIVT